MDDAGERHARDVAGRCGLPPEVPDRLVGVRELLGEEAAAVVRRENARVAPTLPRQRARVLLGNRADVEDVDDEQVPRFSTLDREGSAEHVDGGQGRVPDVVGGVVVVDGAVEPLPTVHPDESPGFTVAAAGMSGCQRLWPIFSWSMKLLFESSG
jgi:hypothetical protein